MTFVSSGLHLLRVTRSVPQALRYEKCACTQVSCSDRDGVRVFGSAAVGSGRERSGAGRAGRVDPAGPGGILGKF